MDLGCNDNFGAGLRNGPEPVVDISWSMLQEVLLTQQNPPNQDVDIRYHMAYNIAYALVHDKELWKEVRHRLIEGTPGIVDCDRDQRCLHFLIMVRYLIILLYSGNTGSHTDVTNAIGKWEDLAQKHWRISKVISNDIVTGQVGRFFF